MAHVRLILALTALALASVSCAHDQADSPLFDAVVGGLLGGAADAVVANAIPWPAQGAVAPSVDGGGIDGG